MGNPLLVYQIPNMTHKLHMLFCMNIIVSTIIIQYINTNKDLIQTKITRLSINQFGIIWAKMRQNLLQLKNLSVRLSLFINRFNNLFLSLLPLLLFKRIKNLSQTPQMGKNGQCLQQKILNAKHQIRIHFIRRFRQSKWSKNLINLVLAFCYTHLMNPSIVGQQFISFLILSMPLLLILQSYTINILNENRLVC